MLWAVDSSSIVGVDLDGMTIDGVTAGFYYCARYDSDIDVSEFYYIMNCDELGYNDGVRKFEVLSSMQTDREWSIWLLITLFTPLMLSIQTEAWLIV